jgi:hypothetical protein
LGLKAFERVGCFTLYSFFIYEFTIAAVFVRWRLSSIYTELAAIVDIVRVIVDVPLFIVVILGHKPGDIKRFASGCSHWTTTAGIQLTCTLYVLCV